jgi:hypothetical protein
MFEYQPPPPIDDQDGYDDDPFESYPEPDRQQDGELGDSFAMRTPASPGLIEYNPDDDPLTSTGSPKTLISR